MPIATTTTKTTALATISKTSTLLAENYLKLDMVSTKPPNWQSNSTDTWNSPISPYRQHNATPSTTPCTFRLRQWDRCHSTVMYLPREPQLKATTTMSKTSTPLVKYSDESDGEKKKSHLPKNAPHDIWIFMCRYGEMYYYCTLTAALTIIILTILANLCLFLIISCI